MNNHSSRDVPSQYKKVVNDYTVALMAAARKLWPIVRELGDTYEVADLVDGRFIVKIEALPRPKTEGKDEQDRVEGEAIY